YDIHRVRLSCPTRRSSDLPQVKSGAAHRFCFVVSVLVAFLHSSAMDWRTSNWNVGLVVACLGGSGRLELGPDDVGSQFMGIVGRDRKSTRLNSSHVSILYA